MVKLKLTISWGLNSPITNHAYSDFDLGSDVCLCLKLNHRFVNFESQTQHVNSLSANEFTFPFCVGPDSLHPFRQRTTTTQFSRSKKISTAKYLIFAGSHFRISHRISIFTGVKANRLWDRQNLPLLNVCREILFIASGKLWTMTQPWD